MLKRTLLLRLLAGLSLAAVAGAVATWAAVAYLEQRWTVLFVVKLPEKPWELPEGAEKVSFRTADGVRLGGWFLEGAAPSNGLTILFLHGNIGTLPIYVGHAQFLQRRGFNVLLFNYRGFGMSEGVTRSEATLDRDATAALRYLTQVRGLDPRSIAFVGGSFGASIAANLAARSPCRAVALMGGVASAKRQMKYARPWVPAPVFWFLSSPLDTIARIGRAKCPVMVIHGASDHLVPLSDAEDVYAAARDPKRFVIVPDARHGFGNVDLSTYLGPLSSFLVEPSARLTSSPSP